MKKVLVAFAILVGMVSLSFAQKTSPHEIDLELSYWVARMSGDNILLGLTKDLDGPGEVLYLSVTRPASPFIIRGLYNYMRELGFGLQYYTITGSATVDERPTDGFWEAYFENFQGSENRLKADESKSIYALDIYHIHNISRTAISSYDLIGGFRRAGTSVDIKVTASADLANDASRTEVKSNVKGALFGPHIGIKGERRFLVEPLRLVGAITVSLLTDTTTASNKQATFNRDGTGNDRESWERVPFTITDPVQVVEGEIALRFTSPKTPQFGASIGYLASQWENVGIFSRFPGFLERGDIGVSGLRVGLNISF